jgi:hypothetical protein
VLGLALAAPSAALANGDPGERRPGDEGRLRAGGIQLRAADGLAPVQPRRAASSVGPDSRAHGYRIKVALISAPSDLGLVYQLWRQPGRYASFLGKELRAFWNYRGRLLVVMPNAYGTYHDGRSVAGEEKILGKLPPPTGPLDIARASEDPVLRLAADRGVKLTLPPLPASAEPKKSNDPRNLVWLAAGALLLIAMAAAAVILIRRRRGVAGGMSSP